MNPQKAKELYDKIELCSLLNKRDQDAQKVSQDYFVQKLASDYGKDSFMIARMVVQIRKNGTYKENKNWSK